MLFIYTSSQQLIISLYLLDPNPDTLPRPIFCTSNQRGVLFSFPWMLSRCLNLKLKCQWSLISIYFIWIEFSGWHAAAILYHKGNSMCFQFFRKTTWRKFPLDRLLGEKKRGKILGKKWTVKRHIHTYTILRFSIKAWLCKCFSSLLFIGKSLGNANEPKMSSFLYLIYSEASRGLHICFKFSIPKKTLFDFSFFLHFRGKINRRRWNVINKTGYVCCKCVSEFYSRPHDLSFF